MKEPRAKGLEAYSPARRVEARCPLTNRTPGRPTPSRIRTPHSRSWPPATGRPGARGGVSRGGVGRAAASPAHGPSRGGTGSARPDCRGGAGGLHADPRERRSDSGGSRERGSGGDRRRRAPGHGAGSLAGSGRDLPGKRSGGGRRRATGARRSLRRPCIAGGGEPQGLRDAAAGRTGRHRTGDQVVALGYPASASGGSSLTTTAGVVSAVGTSSSSSALVATGATGWRGSPRAGPLRRTGFGATRLR